MQYTFNKDFFKKTMREQKISYAKMAQMLTDRGEPITVDGINYWFRGEDNKPEIEKIKIMADILKQPFSNLATIDEEIAEEIVKGYSTVKQVPIVGTASCGIPTQNAYQEADTYTSMGAKDWNKELYAVIADGDSMSPLIERGDEVICDPLSTVGSGDIIHYQLDGESAIKVYIEKGNKFYLVPRNQDFETQEFSKDDERLQNMRKIKVVDIKKSVRNGRKARIKELGF